MTQPVFATHEVFNQSPPFEDVNLFTADQPLVEAVKAARSNPNFRATRRWMAEKIMTFLTDQGMVTWYSRPIYKVARLV